MIVNLTKNYSLNKKRTVWLSLTLLGAIILELSSLYLQHVKLLQPCVLCIYQRCALLGIIFGGIFLSTPYVLMRIGGRIIWMYSSWNGFLFAKKQNDIQLYPSSPFTTCDFFVNFPSWLPLDHWAPFIFYANGDCTEYKWYFLTLELSQWMMIIFLIYLIIPTASIIFSTKKYFKNTYHKKRKK